MGKKEDQMIKHKVSPTLDLSEFLSQLWSAPTVDLGLHDAEPAQGARAPCFT